MAIKTVKTNPKPKGQEGYTTSFNYDKEDNYSASVSVRGNSGNFSLSFNINNLENCCGVDEIGGFRLINTTKIADPIKIKAVQDLLKKIIADNTEYRGSLSYIITVSQEPSCKFMKLVLGDQKIFTKVKTFINVNSSNAVDIYINNN